MGVPICTKRVGFIQRLNTKMQQQSLRFLTTVPTDAEETELAGIREVDRYSVGNMECEE